jgi:hypothetical protein
MRKVPVVACLDALPQELSGGTVENHETVGQVAGFWAEYRTRHLPDTKRQCKSLHWWMVYRFSVNPFDIDIYQNCECYETVYERDGKAAFTFSSLDPV